MPSHIATRATALVAVAFTLATLTAPPVTAAPYKGSPPPPPPVDFSVRPETPWMSPQTIELVVNGGFEGGFAGWSPTLQLGSSGAWFDLGGPGAGPFSGMAIPAPAQGAVHAVTDMKGPGSNYLFQDITIPPLATATLNLVLWYNNYGAVFESPATLDFNVFPNQQFRIDIMDPTAPLDDVGAGVLLNVFATGPASPFSLGYTPISVNLDAFAGQTIRLRFVEVDNQLWFNVGVDAVSLQAEPLVPVQPATWGELKARYH